MLKIIMGRFDGSTWVSDKNGEKLKELEFPKEVFYEFYKKLVKLIETEGL
ncbi:hypothetical protein [Heyndrickxia oleronia]|nr:hypothetical protein [Heyndrickxia oleronia]MCI1759894.1 hypothetical protein [Heyndrickxia oleronia]